jgi:hypothetical protein
MTSSASPAPAPDLWNEYGSHVYVASLLDHWEWLILLGTTFYFMHRAIVAIIRSHQESVYWNWSITVHRTAPWKVARESMS